MPAIAGRIARLILDVQAWAAGRPDVLGVALVGSHARGAARPDSDVDLVIACQRPRLLLDDTRWIGMFGAPMRTMGEDWGRVTSLRVWYANGLEVEFGITDRDWGSAPLEAGTRAVIEDGCIVLYDRGHVFPGIG